VDSETNWREKSAADLQASAAATEAQNQQLQQLKQELELMKQNQSRAENVVPTQPEPTLPPPIKQVKLISIQHCHRHHHKQLWVVKVWHNKQSI
jgi:hypothetical protein